ncbi:MAG: iron-containing alcohol dehydrogenase, partial [Mariprofundaceae bacterium]|nr:iron-containing alcohol dehydrogenase [Mariprofundaceae bacterium]
MLNPFNFAATPHIHFGAGQRTRLKELVASFATDDNKGILLVTGGHSFDASALCIELLDDLTADFEVRRIRVSGEPSPQLVDQAVSEFHAFNLCCVIAIGGGSAVDAAK